MAKYDWEKITNEAYLALIGLDIDHFPIPIEAIEYEGVIICSYQEYAEVIQQPITEVLIGCELEDAFFMDGLRNNLKMILYNGEMYDRRIKHTLWHEIGHMKLGHKQHAEKEEIEAHFFAAQANAPNVLIRELNRRGYEINENMLMDTFGLSYESAQKKMKYIRDYGLKHRNENDDLILQKFSKYINENYPVINESYNDDYFDDLEEERSQWSF